MGLTCHLLMATVAQFPVLLLPPTRVTWLLLQFPALLHLPTEVLIFLYRKKKKTRKWILNQFMRRKRVLPKHESPSRHLFSFAHDYGYSLVRSYFCSYIKKSFNNCP